MKKKHLEMKKNVLKAMLFCLSLITLLTSCREEDFANEANPSKATDSKIASKVSVGQYESEMPYNINVVYFIPSDGAARPEYERRVSEFMIAAQDFYRQNMYNWGYGNRSFGLLKNPATNRVKINVINGALPVSSYPYSGGGNKIQAEVNAWFANHPNDKTSDHTIIFTAVPTPETEIPFYGLEKICFVGDNEAWDYQYFNQNTPQGNKAKWYMGGFLHELGHGLSLSHNALHKSSPYGTSLMSSGNNTYGYSPTVLTKSDCAILNNIQVFSTHTQPAGYFYAPGKEFKITSITGSYSNGRININGTYSTNAPLNSILSHFIPQSNYYFTVTGLADYTSNTFSTYIDVSDLHIIDNENYLFVLQGLYLDGTKTDAEYYYFTMKNGVPTIKWDMNRSNWTVSSSSQQSYFPATYAIDGDKNTYWHTNFDTGTVQNAPAAGASQNFPYYFDIDMGSVKDISGLSFIQHQGLVRTAKNISIYTRNSTTDTWKLENSYILTNTTDKQHVDFPQKENTRYVRLKFESSHDGLPYVAIPEIGAY
ncbi:discoidin domain-containing protein [Chryseobacterium sp. G0201]|nr:discoidin domain-containing protein [Chryseobacterium sp. G0201]